MLTLLVLVLHGCTSGIDLVLALLPLSPGSRPLLVIISSCHSATRDTPRRVSGCLPVLQSPVGYARWVRGQCSDEQADVLAQCLPICGELELGFCLPLPCTIDTYVLKAL